MAESLIEKVKKGKAIFEDAVQEYYASGDKTIGLRSILAIENMSDFREILGYTFGVLAHPVKAYRALKGL